MRAQIQQQQPICWLILRPWLCWALLLPLLLVQGRQHRRAQELFEVRVFEGAPVGTKATLNEAFDRALREMNSCFAQLESDLEWLDFDPVRLIFETVAELPQNSSRPAQYAVLHLLCPQHKHSLHFSLHITRRNRHAPKFLSSDYRFYAPVNLPIGAEIGRVQVQDQDPIIYNSQVQLSIVRATNPGPGSRGGSPSFPVGQSGRTDMEEDPYWEVARNGSLLVRRRLTELRLFRPYQTRLLAVDFGSPQLFSMANITIVPVSVSQPQNVRINVANSRYQIFQWGLPSFGVPERYRLTIRKKGELRPLFEQQLEDPIESMAMTRVRLPVGVQLEVQIAAVDVEGETPSEAVVFQAVDSELYCEGQCSARGLPMCHYSGTQQLEQYRDVTGQPHCLCFAGFSGAQCDRIENCPFERLLESYGGVDWPETPVNLSAAIPCPYNEDGRRLERQCGWERQREKASWGNATNPNRRMAASSGRGSGNGPSSGTDQEADGLCKSQSSVLVHLGVLANYGQRQEQTFSGLQSVMRFLATLLQFPAFQPAIPTAHFDAKIAEHVTQVLDSLVARNLSALGGGGNSSLLSDQVAKYAMEFIRRFPVPFTVQSASGSLQMRAWQVLPTAADSDPLDDPMANGQSVQQLGPCFVQPPPQRHGTRTARAICMRNATLFPLLEGHSPVLMLQMDDGGAENGTMGLDSGTAAGDGGPLVLGFRLPAASAIPSRENFTCAQFDQNEKVWSASGISVLSREFRPHGQILLCEIRASHQTKQSVFALLPESMFRPESVALAWLAKFGPALGAIAVLVTCFCLLLSSALLHRNSDPAQLVLLLSLLLLHLFHLILLLRPQFTSAPFGLAWPSSSALFSTLQLALLSFCAALALLNSSIYSRIVQLELDIRKAPSRSARLFCTLIVTIFLPLSLCVLTSLFDGQILAGLDSDQTQLQPFNWTFGLALLLPLVIFMGSAMGFGAYGLWYGNKLASFASDWPLDSATLLRRRLLHQLSSAGGLSWLILLFPFANLLVLLQPPEPIRSVVMATLYLLTALNIFLFIRLLTRIGRRLPHSRESAVDQGPRSMRENTLVAPLENNHKSNGRNGVGGGHQSEKQQQKPVLVVQQQGLCQPIAPGEILFDTNNNNNGLNSPMIEQQTVDRQFLLKRSAVHQPSHQGPQQLQLGQSQYRQLAIPASQQRHSGTVSTSAGTILLESDDLASLDRAIAAQMVPSNQAGLPANLFAEADTFDEDEEDEDLDAFLEKNPSDMLRSTSSRQQNGKAKSPSLAHPLVSVV